MALSAGPVLTLLAVTSYISMIGVNAESTIYNVESKLQEKLYNNYDKRVRPSKNASLSVNVGTYVHFLRIVNVEPQKHVLTFEIALAMKWLDPRLTWNPMDFMNITHFIVPLENIWIPDIAIYNGVVQPQLTNEVSGYAMLAGLSGQVSMLYYEEVVSSCYMDVYNFPFDVQRCYMTFGTWYHFNNGIVLEPPKKVGSQSADLHNDWYIKNTSVYYADQVARNTITFSIDIGRRPAFYLYMYVAPPVVVSLLTPFIFLLHTSESQRSALGMGIILSMTFLTGSFSWFMPCGRDAMPKLGIYYTASLIAAVLAYMISVVITAAAERSAKLSGPPAIITRVVGELLGSLLCVTRAVSGGVTVEGDAEASHAKVVDTKDESQEWTHLARVLDRVCFIFFTALFIIMTMACLIN